MKNNKKNRSFSEVIKNMSKEEGNVNDVMKFFGTLKGDKNLDELEKLIEKERESSYARDTKW